jgi:hypothetical protein
VFYRTGAEGQKVSNWSPNEELGGAEAGLQSRVARWYIFKPKIPIWVKFGGCCDVIFWYILWPFGLCLCYGHLVYFVAIWYFNGHLVHFSRFGMLHQEKSGNPPSIIRINLNEF